VTTEAVEFVLVASDYRLLSQIECEEEINIRRRKQMRFKERGDRQRETEWGGKVHFILRASGKC